MDEYDSFLRWRKTWQRVTSIRPDWFYDETERCLYIHNPIERYQAGVFCYWPHESTEQLPFSGADWVKRYALAKAKLLLAEVWLKYSGAIPGPLKDLQLDAGRRESASQEIEKLLAELKGMQRAAPITVD